MIGVVALIASLMGSTLLTERLRAGHPSPPGEATLSGLTVKVTESGWLAMDAHSMDQQSGYQMPAQMMPGAPAGDELRLGVRLTLNNTSDQARGFKLHEEFALVGGPDGVRQAHSDTFGLLTRLDPGNAVDGIIYFDTTVPDDGDPPLFLRWTRGGNVVTLPIRIGEADPGHHDPNR